jgi:hypothetical protein
MITGLVSWGISYLCLRGNIVVEYPTLPPIGRWNIPSVSWRTLKSSDVNGIEPPGNGIQTGGPHATTALGPPIGFEARTLPEMIIRSQVQEPVNVQHTSNRRATKQHVLDQAAWERLLFPIAYGKSPQ